jgi:hypothetical protein
VPGVTNPGPLGAASNFTDTNGNVVPSRSKLLFREAGAANPANSGNGFLVGYVSLSS